MRVRAEDCRPGDCLADGSLILRCFQLLHDPATTMLILKGDRTMTVKSSFVLDIQRPKEVEHQSEEQVQFDLFKA